MNLKEQYESDMMEQYRRSTGEGEKDSYGIVCPTYYQKDCKVCDLCKEILFDKGKYPEGSLMQKAASEKNRKHHFYSNVLFSTDQSEIVILDYGIILHDKLLGYQMDPMSQFKFFFDHENGRNLYIVKIPGATKRQTKYDIEPIIKTSPFPNMKLLAKLEEPEYQLHNIVDLMKAGKVKVLGQNKLPMQRTEVRFLPSWLGPDSFVFSHHVMYHFGLSQDEFNAVQEGKLNPFATVGSVGIPDEEKKTGMIAELHSVGEAARYKPISITMPKVATKGWGSFATTETNTKVDIATSTTTPVKEQPTQMPGRPKCFGTFDANNTECTDECMEDGWGKPCQAVKDAEAQIEKRRKAAKVL